MNIIKIITPLSKDVAILEGNVINIFCDNKIVDESEYSFNNTTLTISDNLISKKLKINIESDKKKLIGYTTDNSIYTYSGNNSLKENSKYKLTFEINSIENDFDFSSSLTPLYCKTRDVKNLISTILSNLKEDIDLEYEIFLVSQELDETILSDDNLEDDYSEILLIKLAANMTAYNIVYRYYYSILEEVGSNESTVGSLSEKKSRYAVTLDSLLKRFEKNIVSYEEQLIGIKAPAQSFTKASSSETGLNSRLWD